MTYELKRADGSLLARITIDDTPLPKPITHPSTPQRR